MDEWQEFIMRTEAQDTPSRKSGAGIERSLKWFLDTGPQKKGGYPKKRRPNFKRKKFNDISAPPGAPGGLEEDIDPETFEKHSELEPNIFRAGVMKPKIRKRLLEIVEDFLEELPALKGIRPVDIRLTGSLANYNWSEYSDVDLHIIMDFEEFGDDPELVKAFFDKARMQWNANHDIKIHDYEVEIYVENVHEEHISSGVYSLVDRRWLSEPDPSQVEIDHALARKKSDDMATQINLIEKYALTRKQSSQPKTSHLKSSDVKDYLTDWVI